MRKPERERHSQYIWRERETERERASKEEDVVAADSQSVSESVAAAAAARLNSSRRHTAVELGNRDTEVGVCGLIPRGVCRCRL